MNTVSKVWPLCPRPLQDESLPSWFERVGYEYEMSPALLLGAVEHSTIGKTNIERTAPAMRLFDPAIAEHLAALGQLSDSEQAGLWSPPSDWELNDRSFCTFCPHCCLEDLDGSIGLRPSVVAAIMVHRLQDSRNRVDTA